MISNIIPFFPLTSKDIQHIFKKVILYISRGYENIYWKKLQVDDTVYHHFTDPNYIEYLEYTSTTPTSSNKESFIFAKRGAHDLEDNIFLQALKAFMTRGYFNQSEKIARIEYSEASNELILRWCHDEHHESVPCEEGWRVALD